MTTDNTQPYTVEEEKRMFIECINDYIDDIATKENDSADACEQLAHRMLCLIDGVTSSGLGYELKVNPHPHDKQDALENGLRYHEPISLNSGDYLHDLYWKIRVG